MSYVYHMDSKVSLGIVTRQPKPDRTAVNPGELVVLASDRGIPPGGVLLSSPHPHQHMLREMSTGRPEGTATGCLKPQAVALVLAVDGDWAYVWSDGGRGWLDRWYIVTA